MRCGNALSLKPFLSLVTKETSSMCFTCFGFWQLGFGFRCAQDIPWVVGEVFTPLDALRQVATNVALADLKRLGSKVVQWLDNLEV